MNKVQLIGWIAGQPKMIPADTLGKWKCKAHIVIFRQNDNPDVIALIAEGNMASKLSSFNNGDRIGISGNLRTRLTTREPDGYQNAVLEVMVESIDLHESERCPLYDEFLPGVISRLYEDE